MTKEEIVKYVIQSPENTNPNVLEGMLDELDNGGGLESVTLTFNMTLPQDIELDSITFWNVIEYNDKKFVDSDGGIESPNFSINIIKNGYIYQVEFNSDTVQWPYLLEIDGDYILSDGVTKFIDSEGNTCFRVISDGTISGVLKKIQSK